MAGGQTTAVPSIYSSVSGHCLPFLAFDGLTDWPCLFDFLLDRRNVLHYVLVLGSRYDGRPPSSSLSRFIIQRSFLLLGELHPLTLLSSSSFLNAFIATLLCVDHCGRTLLGRLQGALGRPSDRHNSSGVDKFHRRSNLCRFHVGLRHASLLPASEE